MMRLFIRLTGRRSNLSNCTILSSKADSYLYTIGYKAYTLSIIFNMSNHIVSCDDLNYNRSILIIIQEVLEIVIVMGDRIGAKLTQCQLQNVHPSTMLAQTNS